MARIDCKHCGGRGYYFFWSANSTRQKWTMECSHCAVQRKAAEAAKLEQKKIPDDLEECEL